MAANKEIPYKIYLEENEMPQAWYNVRADMKNKPAPLLNPGTLQPMTAQELDNPPAHIPSPRKSRIFIRCPVPPPWSGPTAWRRS